jgi:hypothetical protein
MPSRERRGLGLQQMPLIRKKAIMIPVSEKTSSRQLGK